MPQYSRSDSVRTLNIHITFFMYPAALIARSDSALSEAERAPRCQFARKLQIGSRGICSELVRLILRSWTSNQKEICLILDVGGLLAGGDFVRGVPQRESD
ncbi:hypothetical protein J6590_042064 [Homalodisca vitripennis]|nr:hypothetical protein J6590_042064 [Homalodisca vitripennis]